MAKISKPFVAPLAKTLLNVALLPFPGAGAIASAGIDTVAAATGAGDAAKKARKKALDEVEGRLVKTLEEGGLPRRLLEDSVDIAKQALQKSPADADEIIRLSQDAAQIAKAVMSRSFGDGAGIESAERQMAEQIIASVYEVLIKAGSIPRLSELAALYVAQTTRDSEIEQERGAIELRAERQRHTLESANRIVRKSRQQISQRSLRDETRPFRSTQAQSEIDRILASDWRDEVRTRVDALINFLVKHRLEPELLASLRSMEPRADLGLVADQLRALRLQPHIIRRHEEEALELDEEERPELPTWRAAQWLARQSRTPEFNWVALISGEWGTGKSRLVNEVARSTWSRDEPAAYVYLQLDGSQTLSAELLSRLEDWTGTSPRSIYELGTVVDQILHGTLVVILDDFDEAVRRSPAYLVQLQDIIENNTDVRNIRWVVIADSLRRDALLNRSNQDFWRRYGARGESTRNITIGGWIELDVVNRQETLGIELLASHAPEQDRGAIAQLRRDAVNFESHSIYLCNPQPAWAQIEASANHQILSAVHQPDAVRAWWKTRRDDLATGPYTVTDVELAVEFISKEMALSGTTLPLAHVLGSLARTFSPALSDEPGRTSMIDNLRQGGLVYLNRDVDETMLLPRAHLLWAQRISDHLFKKMGRHPSAAALVANLEGWAAAADSDWTAEATIQLSFARSATYAASPSFSEVARIWHERPDLPDSHLWAAAVFAPEESQQLVADWLSDDGASDPSDREVYLLLRFADLVANTAATGLWRLRLVRALYERTRDLGLGAYLVHVVGRSLRLIDFNNESDHLEVLQSLVTIDRADEAEAVAKAYVSAVLDNKLEAGRWLGIAHAFLRKAATRDHLSNFPRQPSRLPGGQKSPTDANHRRAHFWQFLLREIADAIVRRDGGEAFEAFLRAGWLDTTHRGPMLRHVATQLRIEVNLAYGHLFLFGRSRDQEDVVDLLDDLIGRRYSRLSKEAQQDMAFFVIRHTRVTSGRRSSALDERIRARLEMLLVDQKFVIRNKTWLGGLTNDGSD